MDETKFIHVTEITRKVCGTSYAMVKPEVLEAARIRGEAIHSDVENGRYESPEAAYIASCCDLPHCRFEVKVQGELHGLPLTGRIDIIEEDTCIYDIKTCASKDMMYWTIQLNLYRLLLGGDHDLAVIWTPKNKAPFCIPIEVLPDHIITRIFNAYKAGIVLGKDALTERRLPDIIEAHQTDIVNMDNFVKVFGFDKQEVTE